MKRTRWLTPEEYTALREAAAPHLRPLVIFLAGTGARLSEALGLQWADVNLRLGTALLRDTKNGRDRQVELLPAVVAAMASITYPVRQEDRTLVEVAERTGSVFRTSAGRPYAETGGLWGGQIATAWAGACRRARLPGSWREGKPRRIQERLVVKGKVVTRIKEVRDRWWQPDDVSPHTLRHTWATWHYAVHRDLLRLKHEGDWSSVGLVERYAKLAPSAAVPAILVSWGAASADAANLGQLRSAI
ncbi:MAG TPA: site-specific integrase [Roseomonas sp.]|nr:site-specific integrase [Roseomonas sp.]